MTKSFYVLCLLPLLLTGCLQTRSAQKEQEEKQVFKKQINTLQQSTADVNSRFQDLEDESRRLNGRIESVESKVAQSTARIEKQQQDSGAKSAEMGNAYKEEFASLRAEIARLKEQLAAVQAEQTRSASARVEAEAAARSVSEARASEAAKGPYASAEAKFDKKNWQGAILDYEKYRTANPKGKQYSSATYKIAVCFQELNQFDDAKAFYEEVIAKYPKSKDADKAATRLKGLAKRK